MDCTESLETTDMASVRFDCSGGGGTVMFCGRFASGDCISDRTVSVVMVIPSCELLLLGFMLLLQLYYSIIYIYIYIYRCPSLYCGTYSSSGGWGACDNHPHSGHFECFAIGNHMLLQSKKRLDFVFL